MVPDCTCFEKSRADTAEHYNSLADPSARARKNKGQHQRPTLMCFLQSILDCMHGKNGLTRNACQQLANVAIVVEFLDQWKQHLCNCCHIYVHWGKYKGKKTSERKRMIFAGNAARQMVDAMETSFSHNAPEKSIIRCTSAHKEMLFDSLSEPQLRLLIQVLSAHCKVHKFFVMSLEEQMQIDPWEIFTAARAYCINMKFAFKDAAVTRYVLSTAAKLTFDIVLCNRLKICLEAISMEDRERFNKLIKRLQKTATQNFKGIKTDIANAESTLEQTLRLLEYNTFALLELQDGSEHLLDCLEGVLDSDDDEDDEESAAFTLDITPDEESFVLCT